MNAPDDSAPVRPFHHTDNGFRNNHPDGWQRGSFWAWQRERWSKGIAKPPPGGWRLPSVKSNDAWLRANHSEPTITWLGHSTFLLQIDGVNLLTDPHLSPRASPFRLLGPKRWMPPALAVEALPHIDIALISHNHYDHLDAATVTRLARQAGGPPRYMVPLKLGEWFKRRGLNSVTERDWWEIFSCLGLTLTFTPVQHWSARSTWDRDRSLWGGWRVDHPQFSFFFAGDTGYSADFKDIRARLGPVDLAALPIGAYAPRWFMQVMHIDPDEAVQIHQDLAARQSVAMHWGTFVLTDEPLDEPPQRLRRALIAANLSDNDFWVMRHGETRRLQLRDAL